MTYRNLILLAVMTAAASSSPSHAAAFQPKGYISNQVGEKCWYTQRTDPEGAYFHGSLKGATGTVTFDDPGCMADGPGLRDVNILMINNAIAGWYYGAKVQKDAAFLTDASDLYPTSMLQQKGQCMRSRTYPAIGVVVDYEVRGSAIAVVRHASAIQGCKAK
jgi:hypothetical protein